MEFVLIDGNSLINRAYYATPPLTAPNGTPTNAVYAFVNMLLKIEEDLKPKYLLVAFDRREPTFRHGMYAEYKAGRKPMPDELGVQIPLLKRVLDAMNICHYEKAGFEADDIIGTLAKKYGYSTAIYTGDKDSFQLVDNTTSVYFTRRGTTDIEIYNNQNFKEKMGIEPIQIIDLKACMGDSSDNIIGISGVGEKTAKDLITTYSTIENLYEHTHELKGKLQEKVVNGKDSAFLSKTLATINTQMEIELSEEDFVVTPLGEKAKKIFLELGFNNILKKAKFEESEKSQENPTQIITITSVEQLEKQLFTFKKVSFAFLDDLHFSNGKNEYKVVIPQNFLDQGLSVDEINGVLKKYFALDNQIILLDIKADRKRQELKGVNIASSVQDISLIKYLVDFSGRIAKVSEVIDEYGLNNNTPAKSLFEIYENLSQKLVEQNMQSLYYDMELPLSSVLYQMEQDGFKIDTDYLEVLSKKYAEKIEDTSKIICEYLGEINLNSPHQLSIALFEKLGLKGGKKLKRGGYSTTADELAKIADQHPVINHILEYRKIQKLKSTYIDGMKTYAGKDNMVHTTFNQALTATGRLSSTEPNLQNIPIRSDEGKEIRKMFISRFDNGVIVSSDYSQIELRLLADFSGCASLINAFSQGQDIHAITASQVFGVPLDKVTSKMRREAKAVNFGIIYGISGFGLAEQLGISQKAGREYIDRYFATYPEVKAYMDANVEYARANGFVTTKMGRKRVIREINATDRNLRGFGERVAMNMPLQGSSADIIKLAMIKVAKRIERENLKTKLILQIHDELVLDSPLEEKDIAEKLLKEEMESITLDRVKLIAESASGNNWYEVK